jgi:hypothetical protein
MMNLQDIGISQAARYYRHGSQVWSIFCYTALLDASLGTDLSVGTVPSVVAFSVFGFSKYA